MSLGLVAQILFVKQAMSYSELAERQPPLLSFSETDELKGMNHLLVYHLRAMIHPFMVCGFTLCYLMLNLKRTAFLHALSKVPKASN